MLAFFKTLPMAAKIGSGIAGIGILLSIGLAVYFYMTNQTDSRVAEAHDTGMIRERAVTQGIVQDEVDKANQVDNAPPNPARDKAQCERDARNPNDC